MQDKSAAGGGFALRVAASFNHRFEGTAEKLRFSLSRRLRRRAAPQAKR